jgi:hypothetical protein
VLAAVGSLLPIALLVVLVVQPHGGGATGPGELGSSAAPTASPASVAMEPVPTPTPTPTPTPDGPHPSSCDQLYRPAMVQALGDLELNPAWARAPDAGVSHGTDDPALRALIDDADHLTCVWASPYGGSGSGLITNLVWVTPEQSAAVEARLAADGLSCAAEAGGRRCVIETIDDEGTFGESHFLRDGIWLATKYTNAGPDGYTQDIVAQVWPGS